MVMRESFESGAEPLSFVDALRRRLIEPLPGWPAQARMSPRPRTALESSMRESDLRPAAALLLLYRDDSGWHIPLTLRGKGLRHHGGQISLPGGRIDAGETAEQTALREASEEIGLAPAGVDLLGRLTPLQIAVSGHILQPVVGYTASRPPFVAGLHEVERIIEIPLVRLASSDAVGWETRERSLPPPGLMEVPFFDVDGARIWGATAMILAEFLEIIDQTTRLATRS
jgi:8-oxo-dGTP pyrophosphatase MutT (NUDIX family)